MTFKKAKELNSSMMVVCTRVPSNKGRSTEKARTNGLTGRNITGTCEETKLTALACMTGRMAVNMKVNGREIS